MNVQVTSDSFTEGKIPTSPVSRRFLLNLTPILDLVSPIFRQNQKQPKKNPNKAKNQNNNIKEQTGNFCIKSRTLPADTSG